MLKFIALLIFLLPDVTSPHHARVWRNKHPWTLELQHVVAVTYGSSTAYAIQQEREGRGNTWCVLHNNHGPVRDGRWYNDWTDLPHPPPLSLNFRALADFRCCRRATLSRCFVWPHGDTGLHCTSPVSRFLRLWALVSAFNCGILFPGPLALRRAGDRPTCPRLWLVQQSSILIGIQLSFRFETACTSSACLLVEWRIRARAGGGGGLKLVKVFSVPETKQQPYITYLRTKMTAYKNVWSRNRPTMLSRHRVGT